MIIYHLISKKKIYLRRTIINVRYISDKVFHNGDNFFSFASICRHRKTGFKYVLYFPTISPQLSADPKSRKRQKVRLNRELIYVLLLFVDPPCPRASNKILNARQRHLHFTTKLNSLPLLSSLLHNVLRKRRKR